MPRRESDRFQWPLPVSGSAHSDSRQVEDLAATVGTRCFRSASLVIPGSDDNICGQTANTLESRWFLSLGLGPQVAGERTDVDTFLIWLRQFHS